MYQEHIRPHLLSLALYTAFALNPAIGSAADTAPGAGTGTLEEVIVTARRRDESLIAVPMSLTRLDGATLEALQYRDIDEFLSLSPGVLVYGGGDRVSSQITIRGVVTPGDLVEPGNAVYVDEIYSSGMRTLLPGFYDIESVQVLKGPQAGLYGRNTTGGAVLITTGQPTGELEARLDTSYAQYGSKVVNGTVNVPVSDTLRMRSTLWYSDRDGGYYKSQVLDKNIDTTRERGGRLTFAVLPNERIAITVTGEYDEIKSVGFRFADGLVEGGQLGPPPLPPEARRNVLRDDLGGLEQELGGVNGKLDLDTNLGAFIAVAGWRQVKAHGPGGDWDGTAYEASYADYLVNPSNPLAIPSPQVLILNDRDRNLNAEVRFITPENSGPLRTQVGVSYFEETTRLFMQIAPARDFAQILAAENKDGDATRRTNQVTTSWAGFTELIWTPAEKIEVTADLRYTHDRKKVDSELTASGYYSSSGSASVTHDESDIFGNWSPGITLAYMPDETLTLFGKYVRGFRAGGFNALVYNPELLQYDSEEAHNYELGLKTLLFDGRLEMGTSVFYLRINDSLVPVSDPGDFVSLNPLQNLGVAETTGLEIDLAARITDGLSLSASGGAYHYAFSHDGPNFFKTRPYAPDYTASLVSNYQHPLTSTLTGIASLGFRHRHGGRVPVGDDVRLDSYNLLDTQLGIRYKQMELTGFVRNALDDNFVIDNWFPPEGQWRYLGANLASSRTRIRDTGRVFGIRFTVIL
ncbi:MAG: TonB-dependent receptor [Halioglobus sp.]|nr:TonB-dependent receptor [Halioglobus sp.]